MVKTEIQRIIEQINKTYTNNWVGVDVAKLFSEINDEIANTKLSLFNNTIHQIIHHIIATDRLVINRLKGLNFQLTAEEDWVPANELHKIKWQESLRKLEESKNELIKELTKKNDEDLNRPVLENFSTVYETMIGNVEHDYYHIGQILILKNLIVKDL